MEYSFLFKYVFWKSVPQKLKKKKKVNVFLFFYALKKKRKK